MGWGAILCLWVKKCEEMQKTRSLISKHIGYSIEENIKRGTKMLTVRWKTHKKTPWKHTSEKNGSNDCFA